MKGKEPRENCFNDTSNSNDSHRNPDFHARNMEMREGDYWNAHYRTVQYSAI